MDVTAAIGIAAAPAIVAAVVSVFRPLLARVLSNDAIPPVAMVLGVGYTVLAWQGGVIDADNGIVAGLLGLTVGLGAAGTREITNHYRGQ